MKKIINVFWVPLQVLIALMLLVIFLVDFLRPLTGFPVPVITSPNDGIKAIQDSFGKFAAQLAFFTIWTNIIIVGTITASWIFRSKINPYWKNAVATYSIIIMIVFFVLIAPFDKSWGQTPWFDFMKIYQHLIIVVFALLWFFTTKTETKTELGRSTVVTSIVPVLYLIFSIALFIATKNAAYPYGFLNFTNFMNLNLNITVSIIMSIIAILLITAIVVGINLLFTKFNQAKAISVKRGKKGAKAASKSKK